MPGYAAAHLKPNGPGDARPTATAIVADENLVGELSNKVILITGCSSGLGIETARALHATGAHLFITARDVKKGQEVVNDIVTSNSGVTAKADVLKLDLDSLQSVRECASNFLSKSKQLNILINNAGVRKPPVKVCTVAKISSQIGAGTAASNERLYIFLAISISARVA